MNPHWPRHGTMTFAGVLILILGITLMKLSFYPYPVLLVYSWLALVGGTYFVGVGVGQHMYEKRLRRRLKHHLIFHEAVVAKERGYITGYADALKWALGEKK